MAYGREIILGDFVALILKLNVGDLYNMYVNLLKKVWQPLVLDLQQLGGSYLWCFAYSVVVGITKSNWILGIQVSQLDVHVAFKTLGTIV